MKYWSALSLLLFAFFFASTNLFIHVHVGESGKKIVHSHPWSAKSHNHTDAQFQLIQQLSNYTFQTEEEIHLDIPILCAEVEISSPLPEIHVCKLTHHVLGLRAPPASL